MRNKKSLDKLKTRSYNSYMRRLQAEKRVRQSGQLWNAAQSSMSTALVTVTIIFLAYPASQPKFMPVVLVILAVLTLVLSFVISFLDHSARARSLFANYRSLQAFSVEVETLVLEKKKVSDRKLKALQNEYDVLLDSSENHLNVDHEVAKAIQGSYSLPASSYLAVAKSYSFQALLILFAVTVVIWSICQVYFSATSVTTEVCFVI